MNIAITGKMRAGKTTLANILVDEYGYEKMSLAEPLKALGKEFLNNAILDLNCVLQDLGKNEMFEYLNTAQLEKDKEVFRTFWQWLGTDFCRKYLDYDDLWVDILLYRLKSATKPVAVDDVRFLNEAVALKAAGFTVVRVVRTGVTDACTGQGRLDNNGLVRREHAHVSETELETIPYDRIFECSDIACLRWAAAELIKSTRGPGAESDPAGINRDGSLIGATCAACT